MRKRQEVEALLRDFKAAIKLGHSGFKQRRKTEEGLIELGLTRQQCWEIISNLRVDNYCSGPQPDHADPSRDVWVFGHNVEGTEIYIKLRPAPDPKRRTVQYGLVWSFHPAERPMKYPLKGKSK